MQPANARADWILYFILSLVGFLEAWLWWVPIRGMLDGNDFQWANSFGFAVLRGPGMLGHFPILVLLSCYVVSMMFLGWRGARMPFLLMLVVLCLVELSGAVVNAVNNPDGYRFIGDSFGIDISLVFWGPALWGVLLAAILWWAWSRRRDSRPLQSLNWTRSNTIFVVLALVLLPAQLILFRSGEQHGVTDQIALVMTISQWVMLNVGFMPLRSRSTEHEPIAAN